MVAFYYHAELPMELGLIKPGVCLDYLPPKARLLTSTCDQPSKTKIYKPTIQCTRETTKHSEKVALQQNITSHSPLHCNVIQTDTQLVMWAEIPMKPSHMTNPEEVTKNK